MIEKFPAVVYKSREEHMTVGTIEEMESAAKKGFGPFEVVVLGRKPVKEDSAEEKEELERVSIELAEESLTKEVRSVMEADVRKELDAEFSKAYTKSDNKYQKEKSKIQIEHNKQIETAKSKIAELEFQIEELAGKLTALTPTA